MFGKDEAYTVAELSDQVRILNDVQFLVPKDYESDNSE